MPWVICLRLVLLIEAAEFVFKSCVYIQCIQCHLSGCNRREQYWTNRPCPFPLPGSAPGCRTGNRAKLSSTQAEPVQAIKSGLAYFPSISCTTSCRRSRYSVDRVDHDGGCRTGNGIMGWMGRTGCVQPVQPFFPYPVQDPPHAHCMLSTQQW